MCVHEPVLGFVELVRAVRSRHILSHHLKCEMKSPHLVDFAEILSIFSRSLADF